nr:MFS-type transporter clz9-like [Hydra vulgaris]
MDKSQMVEAVAAVEEKRMTQRTASKTFKISRCTLQNCFYGKTEMCARSGCSTKLGSEDELMLVEYASKRTSMGIGFGRRQFMKYAGDIARKRGIPFKNGLPSKKWWSLYKKRHSTFRLRIPEGTAAIRHQCMDKKKISIYFNALKQVMDEVSLYCKPHCVWNMDETDLQLQHTPEKVVTKSSLRYIQSRTSGNCETIIATISASGTHIPPHIIVKGKTRRALNGFEVLSAPERSTWSVSDSRWTKQGVAFRWFSESLLTNIGPERPQILILDGLSSHNFIELIDSAIKNNIVIAELPAHTSHWLQPCDRSVFRALKQHYNVAC